MVNGSILPVAIKRVTNMTRWSIKFHNSNTRGHEEGRICSSVAHKSTRAIVRPRIPKWTRYMRESKQIFYAHELA